MSQLFYGSICITDLSNLLKQKHSAFSKGRNENIYANISVWVNDEEDKYGNSMSIQLTPSKEKKDIEERVYVGNCKKAALQSPVSDKDINGLNLDGSKDIPERSTSTQQSASDITSPIDDLPF